MSSNDVFASGSRQEIRAEVRRQFLRGGGAGILAFLGVIGFVYALVMDRLDRRFDVKE